MFDLIPCLLPNRLNPRQRPLVLLFAVLARSLLSSFIFSTISKYNFFSQVFATGTEDMDALTFGSTKLLRHLNTPESRKQPILEFDFKSMLEMLELTHDQFIDLCILCGCDYCETIRGDYLYLLAPSV